MLDQKGYVTINHSYERKIYDINKIIKIQALFRGFIVRKKLKKPKDNMDLEKIHILINIYNRQFTEIENINKSLLKKKIRHQNYPSEISENIAKFAIYKKYKVLGTWDTDKGDLDLLFRKIEIKGFMSIGPCSFGPEEKWDWIYFVDCKKFMEKKFAVYEIKLSNTSEKWRDIIISGQIFDNSKVKPLPDNLNNIKISELRKLCDERGLSKNGNKKILINKLKNQEPGNKFGKIKKMKDLCSTGKGGIRPHICFDSIKLQLNGDVKLIWSGYIDDLK